MTRVMGVNNMACISGCSALAKDLVDFLGLPEATTEFHIHAKVNEVMTVDCKSYIEKDSLETIAKKYKINLKEIEE